MSKSKFRRLTPADREIWSILWQGYLDFYKQELSAEQTQITWERFFDPNANSHAFVIEVDGEVAGLAHCTFHVSTWYPKPDLYLEDLFVSPKFRRQGLGLALIEGCTEFAKQFGSSRMYWMTQRSNVEAQALYYKVAELSEFIIFKQDFSS